MKLAFLWHLPRYTVELAKRLAKQIDVHVYSNEKLAIDRTPVHNMRKLLWLGGFLEHFIRLFDLYHLNSVHQALKISKFARIIRVPYVFVSHTFPLPKFEIQPDMRQWYEEEDRNFEEIASNAAHVISVSRYVQKNIAKRYNVKSTVIYHGVDWKYFNPNVPRNIIRKKYSIKGPLILTVTRLHPLKDPLTLIHSIPLVVKVQPDAKFMMVGSGPLKSSIIAEARHLDVMRHLLLVDRITPYSCVDLNYYYSAADLFVSTSIHEGFGLVALEAIASGKPTIVSDIPPFKEIFSDCCLFFKKSDAKDFADKILRLLLDREFAHKVSMKGLSNARNSFSWDVTARKYLDVYGQVAKM